MARIIAAALLIVLAAAGVAHAAVTPDQLRTADVVIEPGANRPAADRDRLQQAADDLKAKGFPVKFAVVATAGADLDKTAKDLRRGIGESTVAAVLVLGPRRLGTAAKVFDCERRLAFDAEVSTLRTDDIQGTINVARRLRDFDREGALRDSDCNVIDGPTKDSGVAGWLIGLLVGAGVVGLGAIAFLIRRSVRRGGAQPGAPADEADPPDER